MNCRTKTSFPSFFCFTLSVSLSLFLSPTLCSLLCSSCVYHSFYLFAKFSVCARFSLVSFAFDSVSPQPHSFSHALFDLSFLCFSKALFLFVRHFSSIFFLGQQSIFVYYLLYKALDSVMFMCETWNWLSQEKIKWEKNELEWAWADEFIMMCH